MPETTPLPPGVGARKLLCFIDLLFSYSAKYSFQVSYGQNILSKGDSNGQNRIAPNEDPGPALCSVSSIACEMELVGHTIVVVWRGELIVWGLTEKLARSARVRHL